MFSALLLICPGRPKENSSTSIQGRISLLCRWLVEQVAQRCYGVVLIGDIQDLSGHNPVFCALGWCCWSRSDHLLVVPSNLTLSVTQTQRWRKLILIGRCQRELKTFPWPKDFHSHYRKYLSFQIERTHENLHWHGLIEGKWDYSGKTHWLTHKPACCTNLGLQIWLVTDLLDVALSADSQILSFQFTCMSEKVSPGSSSGKEVCFHDTFKAGMWNWDRKPSFPWQYVRNST